MAQGNGNYHIYIHQTKEIIKKKVITHKFVGSSNGTSTDGFSSKEKDFNIPNISSKGLMGVAKAAISGSKFGVAVAVVCAIAKATEQAQKAVGKLVEQTASATGDYSWSIEYNNMATIQHNIFHPISSTFQAQQTEANWARANKRAEEQRSLLGDTAINTLTKGV